MANKRRGDNRNIFSGRRLHTFAFVLKHKNSEASSVKKPFHNQNITARWAGGVELKPPINAVHMEAMATVRQYPHHISINKLHQADCTFCQLLPVDFQVVHNSGE